MAKFLNTSATNYFLEELIKNARDRLILISPFLKLNDRIKELLSDKDRLKIDVRIVYGKSELQPEEVNWLKELTYIRTSFCKNLHAKCYINEELCIITSLNLYEFSQINNNEMGILLERTSDPDLYKEAYEEAQRIIRISEEVRISMERVEQVAEEDSASDGSGKIATSRLATKHKLKTAALIDLFISEGYIDLQGDKQILSEKGKSVGAEAKSHPKYGPYFVWPEAIKIPT